MCPMTPISFLELAELFSQQWLNDDSETEEENDTKLVCLDSNSGNTLSSLTRTFAQVKQK